MGTTWYPKMNRVKKQRKINAETCPVCSGRGEVRDKHTKKDRKCLLCDGKGEVKVKAIP